jgi:MSHA biogenesis protein MshQ
MNIQVFDVPGNYNWTAPEGVLRIIVEAWGGGGAGACNGGSGCSSSGGGGGAYAKSSISVTPGAAYTIQVGSGGVACPLDLTLQDGGSTTFNNTLVIAGGGNRGNIACIFETAPGAEGGLAVGDIAMNGQRSPDAAWNSVLPRSGGSSPNGGFGGTPNPTAPGGGSAGLAGNGAPGRLVIYY